MAEEFTYREDEVERRMAEELGIDYDELLLAEKAGEEDVEREGQGNT